jgi:2-polyprenyl-3-methyl-5-hydroxy-6-metoxy-1,4-benzoquinol methylase
VVQVGRYRPPMARGDNTVTECPVCGAAGSVDLWHEDGWDLVRCQGCDLVYLANPPGPEELAALYSFESGFHTEYDAEDDTAARAADHAAAHQLDLMAARQSPGELLDVGCAAGNFLVAARDRGWTVHGVELNPDTAELARAKGLDVMTGTLDDVTLAEGSLDAVTMWDVIEHVPDPLALLSAARRLLAPDGLLWLATPNVAGLFPVASLKVAGPVGRWPHPEPPYHLFQFSAATISEALRRAGFRSVSVRHGRIPLSFTFGTPATVVRDPRRLAYTAVFAPLAAIGPVIGRGDNMVVSARPT